MIISRESRYIFVEIPKTASTALRHFLIKNTKVINNKGFGGHWTLEEGLKNNDIMLDEIDNYDIISVIRNPLDRVLSAYLHDNMDCDFDDYVRNGRSKRKEFRINQVDFVKLNGKIMSDMWLFDDLNAKLSDFLNKKVTLPVQNKTAKYNRNDYYTEELKMFVLEKYKEDVDMYLSKGGVI